MLWSGDAASAGDRHPAAYTDSKVSAITVTQQVGEGWVGPAYAFGSIRHALLWSGDVSSTARTVTITMPKDMKVTANFR